MPSLQFAARGLAGGCLIAEIGGRHFGLLGRGRTNLKDYNNLNFEPDDSVLVGASTCYFPRRGTLA